MKFESPVKWLLLIVEFQDSILNLSKTTLKSMKKLNVIILIIPNHFDDKTKINRLNKIIKSPN